MRILLTMLMLCFTTQAMAGNKVVILLDSSGSMNESMKRVRTSRMEVAHSSLLKVIDQIPQDDDVALLTFTGWSLPLGPLDQASLKQAVMAVEPITATPLGQYMKIGADALLEKRQKDQYGTYKLLVVTDGEASDPDLLNSYLPDIISRGIIVDVIGLDMEDHSLRRMAHSYMSADNPESLSKALSVALAELPAATDTTDDFEMLQALDSEVAEKVVDALVTPRNQPIGQAEFTRVVDSSGNVTFVPPPAASTGVGLAGVFLLILVAVVVLIALLSLLQ